MKISFLGAAFAALFLSTANAQTGAVAIPFSINQDIRAEVGTLDRSGYGAICENVHETPAGSITGTNNADFVIDSQGCVAPSGTYGNVKSWTMSIGSTSNLTLPSGRKFFPTLVTGKTFIRQNPADNSTSYQLRNVINTAYNASGALSIGDTIVIRDGGYVNSTSGNQSQRIPIGGIKGFCTVVGGSSYTNGSYHAVPLTGGSGTGALAYVYITGGVVANVHVENPGTGYVAGDILSASNSNLGGTGSGFTCTVINLAGRITVTSEHIITSYDSNGNPTRGGTGSIGFFGIVSDPDPGKVLYPFDIVDVSFVLNQTAGGTMLNCSINSTSGYGVNVRRSSFRNLNIAGDQVEGVAVCGGDIKENHFSQIGQAFTGSSYQKIGVDMTTTMTDNIAENIARDVNVMAGEKLYVARNFSFNFNITTGHPDCWQHTGEQDGAAHPNFGTFEKDICVRDVSTPAKGDAQGVFLDDTNSPAHLDDAFVLNNIYNGTYANSIWMNRFNSPVVKYNTNLVAWDAANYTSGQGNTLNASTQIVNGAGGTITNNVQNNFSVTNTGTTQSNNVTVAKTTPAYTGAFPNYRVTPIKSRLQALYVFTPSSTGTMAVGDGTFVGALFPACPGQSIGAWNDGTVWNCSDASWSAAHPPAN